MTGCPYSFWKSATKRLFSGLSMSWAQWDELNMPSMEEPTALMTSSSAEKPGRRAGHPWKARRDELLDEGDAHAAGQEEEQGVGLQCADLGEFGGVVELAEFGVWTSSATLPLVEALEAGDGILAPGVVGVTITTFLKPLSWTTLPTARGDCRSARRR